MTTQDHPAFQPLTSIYEPSAIQRCEDGGGLNIEGLEISPDPERLLIGFRSPLHNRRALIANVENPGGIFEAGEAPRIAPSLQELDLGGHGIRGLAFVPALGEYRVIGGPVSGGPARHSICGVGAACLA